MFKTILAPNTAWPKYTPKGALPPREDWISTEAVLTHIKNGENQVYALEAAMGFKANSIRRRLYRMRDEGLIEAVPVRGGATIWRAL